VVQDRVPAESKVTGAPERTVAVACGAASRGHPAIRIARGEEERACGGRGAQHEHQCQGHQEAGYPSHDHSPVIGLDIAVYSGHAALLRPSWCRMPGIEWRFLGSI